MGMYHATYHFYGVHVPRDQWVAAHPSTEGERVDKVIGTLFASDTGSDRLGHATAGDYDRDMLFLAVGPLDTFAAVELGEYRSVSPDQYRNDVERWNDLLRRLAEAMGYSGLDAPGWITVPDVS